MPLALKGLLKPRQQMAIRMMCKILRRLYTKVYNLANFESLQLNVVEIMAQLEMEFPLSFFDMMTHVPYHQMQELDLCGPISTK